MVIQDFEKETYTVTYEDLNSLVSIWYCFPVKCSFMLSETNNCHILPNLENKSEGDDQKP